MKRILIITTILLLLCSPAWGTDYSDGRCITLREFYRDFNLISLVDFSDPFYTIYYHNHMEIIDDKVIIKTFSVDSYELKDRICDED